MHQQYATLMQFAKEDTQQATLKGSVYRKQLAKYQDWVNPDYPWFSDDPIMTLDDAWGEKIVENFNNDVLGSPVPVPFNHTDDVKENTGYVLSLESVKGDGLYGELQINDPKAIEALDSKTIFDVSISFAWDFMRTDNNKKYGPTLCHVALVNTPYLMGMSGFEKIGQALSRIQKPSELSFAGSNVIMLSRNTMKELSNMATVKNDKDFPVTVKFTEGDEDKEIVVEPGAEVDVPDEVSEAVLEQLIEAEKPTDTTQTDTVDTDSEDTTPVEPDTAIDETGGSSPEDDEKAELARLKQENAELKLSRAYDQLLSEGKVTPAQKDKIMGLAKISQNVELSSGTKTDLASVVLDILGTGVQKFSTEETGSSKEPETQDQSDEGKKPSELLTEDELAGMKAVGADPAKLDEMAEVPGFREALASLSKK